MFEQRERTTFASLNKELEILSLCSSINLLLHLKQRCETRKNNSLSRKYSVNFYTPLEGVESGATKEDAD